MSRWEARGVVGDGDQVTTAWAEVLRSVGQVWSAVQSNAVLISGAGIVAVVSLLVLRRYLVHSKLASRETVELTPSDEFEVDQARVFAIAKRWAQVRPARRHRINWTWSPAATHALRVSLVTDADGLLRYRVTAPGESLSLLTSTAYPDVDVRIVDRDTGMGADIPTMASWRARNGVPVAQPAVGEDQPPRMSSVGGLR